MAGKRAPDFRLKVTTKSKPARSAFVGAAWVNESPNGQWLTVRLDPGVVLSWDDELHIGLFPAGSAEVEAPALDEKTPF